MKRHNSKLPFPEGQNRRLVDVFMFGPLMLYYGLRPSEVHPAAKFASTLIGFGTVAISGLNWLAVHKKYKRAQRLGLMEPPKGMFD